MTYRVAPQLKMNIDKKQLQFIQGLRYNVSFV